MSCGAPPPWIDTDWLKITNPLFICHFARTQTHTWSVDGWMVSVVYHIRIDWMQEQVVWSEGRRGKSIPTSRIGIDFPIRTALDFSGGLWFMAITLSKNGFTTHYYDYRTYNTHSERYYLLPKPPSITEAVEVVLVQWPVH